MLELRCVLPARLLPSLLAAGWISLLAVHVAHADDRERISALEENDSLYFNSDRHYTQGIRLSYLAPDLRRDSDWNEPFQFLGSFVPAFAPEGADNKISRRYAIFVGQSVFTPKEIRRNPPDPLDRPYAGWLYAGMSLLQENNARMIENLELQLGVVGPAAFAHQVQNDYHQFIGADPAKGWDSQIGDEPGLVLSYERLWRLPMLSGGDIGMDVVPALGATVGNILTYGQAGALLRVGNSLRADYGPVRIRPALSGTDYFAGDRAGNDFGYYFFAGVQGRAVGRNIFLDGNSFRRSPGVDKKRLVADLQAGFSLFWCAAARLDFSVVRRSEEFEGQDGADTIGTASLAFSW